MNALTLNTLKLHLKLLALKALPEIERQAVAVAQAGITLASAAKRAQGTEYIVTQYAKATANVPGLKDTLVDDQLVREHAGEAIDWAFGQIGGLLNGLVHAPVTDDGTLPQGGLK
ncbi:hypothetical protein GCM10022631_01570 [Deinococcus rubellus]|uniref:Uncharacterized protein n=1 Tax=Deinococcus rubellus TaxID=1889240 RepID=A0ABY5YKW1_9DEIO|nr:hypothetical protein [Deinococcus rubellus]UWX64737.1 hypothetical protein N0D28_03500 [Deinococcus rubellus]